MQHKYAYMQFAWITPTESNAHLESSVYDLHAVIWDGTVDIMSQTLLHGKKKMCPLC